MAVSPVRWPVPGTAFALVFFVASCASHLPAPVHDRSGSTREPESEYREVVSGDTLYSIAWESGRDYRELAAWNQIPYPYVIRPGEKIRLHAPKDPPASSKSSDVRVVRAGDTLYRIATEAGVSPGELAAWNNISPPYLLRIGQRLRLQPPSGASREGGEADVDPRQTKSAKATESAPRARSETSKPPSESSALSKSATKKPVGKGTWIWPTQGAVIARFGSSKGIDIGGKKGQPIVASSDGRVVYKGSGLRGYGELIIVKHNAEFLSAYAHANKTYVKEGDVVKRGQRIADMGSTGTDRPKLHFEIRYRGNPVDPLQYLPN